MATFVLTSWNGRMSREVSRKVLAASEQRQLHVKLNMACMSHYLQTIIAEVDLDAGLACKPTGIKT